MKFTLEIDIEESTVMAGHYLGYVMERAASLLKLADAERATLATWDAFDRRGQARDAFDCIVGKWQIDSHARKERPSIDADTCEWCGKEYNANDSGLEIDCGYCGQECIDAHNRDTAARERVKQQAEIDPSSRYDIRYAHPQD